MDTIVLLSTFVQTRAIGISSKIIAIIISSILDYESYFRSFLQPDIKIIIRRKNSFL